MDAPNRSISHYDATGDVANPARGLRVEPKPEGDKFACASCHPFTRDKCFSCINTRLETACIAGEIKTAMDNPDQGMCDDASSLVEEFGFAEIEGDELL